MVKDWGEQNRANGQWMLRQLRGLGCYPRRSGREDQYCANCPFHDDEHPSFSLNEREGIFHCFGCELGGTIREFAHCLRTKGYTLDRKVDLSKVQKQKLRREVRRQTQHPILKVDHAALLDCYQHCIEYWSRALLTVPPYRRLVCDPYQQTFEKSAYDKGTNTMKHETHTYVSPQFSAETITAFRIGFAPHSSVELLGELRRKFDKDTIIATGLFRLHGNGGVICLLAGRVVYPYLSNSEPVYAIGRITEYTPNNLSISKYYKQRTYWDRGSHRYDLPLQNPPLFHADVIGSVDSLLITEGITDAIKASEAWVPAISPTTITFQRCSLNAVAEQLRDKTVIICNDNEVSGIGGSSTQRMRAELSAAGVDVFCLTLPRREDQEKVDVCSFIRDEGATAFHEVIEEQTGIAFRDAPSRTTVALSEYMRGGDAELTPQEMTRAVELIFTPSCPC